MIHRGKKFCPELDWKITRDHIRDHGMRNSNTMAIAPLPLSPTFKVAPLVLSQIFPRFSYTKTSLAT